MASIERATPTTPVPVEQAQLIDPASFRFSNVSAEAMKASGEVLFELGRRELEARNSLAVNEAIESRNLAKLKMRDFMKNNPDPDTWSEAARDIVGEQQAAFSKLRFNDKTQDKQEVDQDAFIDTLNMEVDIAAVTQNIENDITISGKNLIDTISNDDGTPEAAKDTQDAIERLQDALERKYEPEVAAIHLEETLKEAKEQQIENAKKDLIERASIRPALMRSAIDAELKARSKGKKALDEFKLMTNEDLIKIRDYAESVENNAITAEKLEQQQTDDEIGDGFLELLANKLDPTKPQLTFDMINDSEMSFDAKVQWFTKLMTFDNYSESELKEAFTDKGEVLADIYGKIDDETITDELDTMVGKGLSPTTAQRIKKERREPFESRTDKLFKNIFGWSPELGFENDLSSFLYLKTEREWREEIKKQDATGEQIIDIGRAIARPYFIEHLQKTMMGQEADIARMVELALGEIAPKTEPEVLPKEDEGPRTIQDFYDEIIRLKAIDTTKAKAYYDAWAEKFSTTEGAEEK